MDAFVGMILPVAFNYPPPGWLFCNGQVVDMNQYQVLYALLGNRYGGNAATGTFGLPDLRGRTMVGSQGQGTGLVNVAQGQAVGAEVVTVSSAGSGSFTLGVANLPPHNHTLTIPNGSLTATSTLNVSATTGVGAPVPTAGAILSGSGNSGQLQAGIYYTGTAALPALPTVALHPASVGTVINGDAALNSSSTGGTAAVNFAFTTSPMAVTPVIQPSIGMDFIICCQGLYPQQA